MDVYGLIGFPLSHSFSRGYFAEKFRRESITDACYENFPLEKISQFPKLLEEHRNLKGLNVTIPYKQSVMPYLDKIDAEAEAIGAVNTIVISDKETKGYNTDVFGFVESLRPLLGTGHVSALILGTGGASKAVAYGLKGLSIPYKYVSRSGREDCMAYAELTERMIRDHKLIINTTPLGMWPDTDSYPHIPYSGIGDEHILYDLVYNPEVTKFLEFGKQKGARIMNGLEMLHLQAERAWQIWHSEQ